MVSRIVGSCEFISKAYISKEPKLNKQLLDVHIEISIVKRNGTLCLYPRLLLQISRALVHRFRLDFFHAINTKGYKLKRNSSIFPPNHNKIILIPPLHWLKLHPYQIYARSTAILMFRNQGQMCGHHFEEA